jgi:hypothetical protein
VLVLAVAVLVAVVVAMVVRKPLALAVRGVWAALEVEVVVALPMALTQVLAVLVAMA